MKVTGLHLLLTYECNFECDHCFVWGGPRQNGTMTLRDIHEILEQAKDAGPVEWIYFEGGEPFLYYAVLTEGVQAAARQGFKVGIVSNGYWANDPVDALKCLEPFAGLVLDLSLSSDSYHSGESPSRQTRNAVEAAQKLEIPVDLISIAEPEMTHVAAISGQIPAGESAVVFRGRAVEKLAARADRRSWEDYDECPFEDLKTPERVHIDPFGYVHICQGISIGNLFQKPLREIFADYDPELHPVTGPLLAGGPAGLARTLGFDCQPGYSDACHLCYEVRRNARDLFPHVLAPDQMYGVMKY